MKKADEAQERLVAALGCDERTLRRWRKLDGAPPGDDLDAWSAFKTSHGLGRDASKTKTELQEEILRRDIKLRDLKIAKEEGATISLNEMGDFVARFSAKLDQCLTLKIETEAPARVQGKDIVSIRAEMRKIHDEIREIYNAGLLEWKPNT